MTAKYKFPLEPVLKLKDFELDQIKNDLGKINLEYQSKQDLLEGQIRDIGLSYQDVEESLATSIEARIVQFVPYYLNAKRQNIKILKQQLEVLAQRRDDLIIKLAQKKAEIKVIEGLKEKKISEHKKMITKKKDQEIEELNQVRKYFREEL